jgi:hypothetical protein
MDMRKLWEDHITWTRVVIISIAASLQDVDMAIERLTQNQVSLGNSIKPFYGDLAGDKLTALLKEHISGAVAVTKDAKAKDKFRLDMESTKWYANANEIADFLSAANPANWPQSELRAHMKEHLTLTMAEAAARIQGMWKDDIGAYDDVHNQILKMADVLSEGIIAQFPERF